MLILTYIKCAIVSKAVSVTVLPAVIGTDALLKDGGSAGTDTACIAVVAIAVKSDNGNTSVIIATAVAAPEVIVSERRFRFTLVTSS